MQDCPVGPQGEVGLMARQAMRRCLFRTCSKRSFLEIGDSVKEAVSAMLILNRPVLRLSQGFMGLLGWWRGVSRLTCLVASHAVLSWRAGEGGGLILPALAKSAPTLPSPPRHPGTARCAACGVAYRNSGCTFPAAMPSSRVIPHSGAGAHGIARARGEPFRQSLLAVCGGRLTP